MDQLILFCVLTGIMLFSYWLNYCMGTPLAKDVQDVDINAILFGIPKDMANNRIHKNGLHKMLWDKYVEEAQATPGTDAYENRLGAEEYHRNRYQYGRVFFLWEKSVLCPICLHFWMTAIFVVACLLLNTLHVRDQFWFASFIYLFNHLLIRKIV